MNLIRNKNFSINWEKELEDDSKVILLLKLLKVKNLIQHLDKTFFGSVYDYYTRRNQASVKQVNSIRKAILKRYIKCLNEMLYMEYDNVAHEYLQSFAFEPSEILYEEVDHTVIPNSNPLVKRYSRPCPCCGEEVDLEAGENTELEIGFCVYCGISIEYSSTLNANPF